VEARVQGDEGESPGEVENPGEHRAPGGLTRYLEATDSRGEKGLEDEPLSLSVALPCSRGTPGFGPRAEGQGGSGLKTRHRLRPVAHGGSPERPGETARSVSDPCAIRAPQSNGQTGASRRGRRLDARIRRGRPDGVDATRAFGPRRSRGRTPAPGTPGPSGPGRVGAGSGARSRTGGACAGEPPPRLARRQGPPGLELRRRSTTPTFGRTLRELRPAKGSPESASWHPKPARRPGRDPDLRFGADRDAAVRPLRRPGVRQHPPPAGGGLRSTDRGRRGCRGRQTGFTGCPEAKRGTSVPRGASGQTRESPEGREVEPPAAGQLRLAGRRGRSPPGSGADAAGRPEPTCPASAEAGTAREAPEPNPTRFGGQGEAPGSRRATTLASARAAAQKQKAASLDGSANRFAASGPSGSRAGSATTEVRELAPHRTIWSHLSRFGKVDGEGSCKGAARGLGSESRPGRRTSVRGPGQTSCRSWRTGARRGAERPGSHASARPTGRTDPGSVARGFGTCRRAGEGASAQESARRWASRRAERCRG
jgi:hypothetical protein